MSETREARRRDSARSREALLRAAGELFAERGFDRTTIRDIGRHAGVDPALIARYFGGKTQLYLATVEAEHGDADPGDLLDPERLRYVLERADSRGLVPVFQVAVQRLAEPAAEGMARAALHDRLVEPLHRRFVAEGRDRPRLRAEMTVAAVIGIALGRQSGAFDELGGVPADELGALLLGTLAAEH
ncbi:TetR/AcrR family transcriptional regulator [Streptomyces sp. Ru73]|uniref:TetR/AcrR family transcriptional regulator n=1 Tax=Streptomyces sp. Ru73 TaxID=2080748 RepID=UPI000CDDDA77|nr:TetR/AcrR family transcriptional regulator [Streptomyces sp. Ru73]POX43203.1 TetR/AcrR family transcriptional regulator [Streptomyces sp. Ru73]